jgi:hypothetical protein
MGHAPTVTRKLSVDDNVFVRRFNGCMQLSRLRALDLTLTITEGQQQPWLQLPG